MAVKNHVAGHVALVTLALVQHASMVLEAPTCPACGYGSPQWDGAGTSTETGSWDAWLCSACGHEWREEYPSP